MSQHTVSMTARPVLAALPRAAMLQFMSLLPLGVTDVEALVARAVAQNPALDRGPGWTCGTCGGFCRSARCPSCSITARPADPSAVADWRAELRGLVRLELPRTLFPHIDLVIDSLDERGLLTEPAILQAETGSGLATARDAVRRLGPPGIAAASATDCVRRQVMGLVERGLADPVLLAIVDDWLQAVADGQYARIATGLGITEQRVRDNIVVLTTSTRPFVSLVSAEPRAPAVDVEFAVHEGELIASVAASERLALRLADDIGPLDREARAWWAPYRREAARLVAAVDARTQLLGAVAGVLAVRQRGYLLSGHGHRPLRRAEVAAQLGVHPSTVSRAVTGKAARCPDGRILPLAALFGGTTSVLELVAAAIADAPSATDAALAAELVRQGTPVARRTVAKYRAILRDSAANPPSHLR